MLFVDLARASDAVAATSKRSEKVAHLAAVIAGLAPAEVVPAVSFLVGDTHLGRVGVGWATLSGAAAVEPAPEPTLQVADVAGSVEALAALGGAGSSAERARLLGELMGRCTDVEQRFLVAVLGGELRQGALAGVVTTAVATAAGVPVGDVQRAAMMAGSLPDAAVVALVDGLDGLRAVALQPLRPVQPMLASTSPSVADAIEVVGLASVEWKLDGARVQAHRSGDQVRVFTRNLNEVTERLHGVVEVVRSLGGGDLVLDGEVLGVADDGRPRPFQDSMGDFGASGTGAEIVGRGAVLRPFFFDVLHADGRSVVAEPLRVRREMLAEAVREHARLPSIVTDDVTAAEAFLAAAVAAGHEGVMVKDIESPYEAGRRGGAWRKVKPVHTFDLVVLAVEWGHGRRTGLLSNLHLGARADDGSGFVMVGKTFKGLTDELLRWQTDRFQELATASDRHVVHVRPEQVVEIAVDGVQRSTRYAGGVALRFARVRGYRHDKSPAEADTISAVRSLLPS